MSGPTRTANCRQRDAITAFRAGYELAGEFYDGASIVEKQWLSRRTQMLRPGDYLSPSRRLAVRITAPADAITSYAKRNRKARQLRMTRWRGAPQDSSTPLAAASAVAGYRELAEAERLAALGCHLALIETWRQFVTERGHHRDSKWWERGRTRTAREGGCVWYWYHDAPTLS